MTTATLYTLPLDDGETAMLKDLVTRAAYDVYPLTCDTEQDIREFESLSALCARCAAVLRMVVAQEALAADSWLVDRLRDYEAEHVDVLAQLRTSLRELRAGVADHVTGGRTFEESIQRDQQATRRYEERLATCQGLLRRCGKGGDA
jgi:DNA repair ATPase RecN